MKAIIFATAMTIVLLAVVTIALRFYQTAQRAKQMTLIYFGCVILLVLAWFTTSVDLARARISARILVHQEAVVSRTRRIERELT